MSSASLEPLEFIFIQIFESINDLQHLLHPKVPWLNHVIKPRYCTLIKIDSADMR